MLLDSLVERDLPNLVPLTLDFQFGAVLDIPYVQPNCLSQPKAGGKHEVVHGIGSPGACSISERPEQPFLIFFRQILDPLSSHFTFPFLLIKRLLFGLMFQRRD